MTKSEILRDYKLSKNPNAQIRVLADLNGVSKQKIVDILKEMGVDGRRLPHPMRPKKKEDTSIADHLSMLIEALEFYRKSTFDALEEEVNIAEEKFKKIEDAISFVKKECDKCV